MTAFVTAGAGFLLAVLWFDLMFDVQARGHRGELPAPALDSITAYYGRVTGTARPMNLLIALVMVATLAAAVIQLARNEAPTWVSVATLGLGGGGIALAGAHTVPRATRLGSGRDDAVERSRLARSVLADHVVCGAAIAAVVAIQLAFA